MITKEYTTKKTCILCVNEYHLEMILLPYIKEKLENSKIIVFTEESMQNSINILLTKTNLTDKDKERILHINWHFEDNVKFLDMKKYIKDDENIVILINGRNNYIKKIKSKVTKFKYEKMQIVDCFHVDDPKVDIKYIKKNYDIILNTQKLI